MNGIVHPFTAALYEQDGEGNVRVVQEDGRIGIYSAHGQHLGGEKMEVDLHMLGWIGGPKVKHHRLEE